MDLKDKEEYRADKLKVRFSAKYFINSVFKTLKRKLKVMDTQIYNFSQVYFLLHLFLFSVTLIKIIP